MIPANSITGQAPDAEQVAALPYRRETLTPANLFTNERMVALCQKGLTPELEADENRMFKDWVERYNGRSQDPLYDPNVKPSCLFRFFCYIGTRWQTIGNPTRSQEREQFVNYLLVNRAFNLLNEMTPIDDLNNTRVRTLDPDKVSYLEDITRSTECIAYLQGPFGR